jgi:hypothetical protein
MNNMIPITKSQREAVKQKIIDDMAYPWDRQPGESEKAFTMFLRYLAIGRTRNYIKVSQTTEINYPTVCECANKYSWKLRADKHDLAKEEEFRIKLDEEILQSRVRQQRLGADMQELGAKGITMLKDYTEELSASDISKLIDIGVKIERLALNSSTEITESKLKMEAEVKVEVEEIPKEICEKIGKLIAIKESKEVEV